MSLKKDGASGCSPYARGWSQRRAAAALPPHLLPARAWMVQHAEHVDDQRCLFPAPSGGPIKIVLAQLGRLSLYPWGVRETNADYMGEGTCCSPRPRGCSHGHATDEADAALFPVPAGMVLRYRLRGVGRSTAPCTFGGPSAWSSTARWPTAPCTCGDGPSASAGAGNSKDCSPHWRGCSHGVRQVRPVVELLPAPAGMLPATPASASSAWTAPARAGMFPGAWPMPVSAAAPPRIRGGVSTGRYIISWRWSCVPYPRGWSRLGFFGPLEDELLPAPAGMVPPAPERAAKPATAPRTRRDGPDRPIDWKVPVACSPHALGCSPVCDAGPGVDGLFPAPARMCPRSLRRTRGRRTAPRSSGVGPGLDVWIERNRECSPHAGMVPT